jgi:hypothetical protein
MLLHSLVAALPIEGMLLPVEDLLVLAILHSLVAALPVEGMLSHSVEDLLVTLVDKLTFII